MIRATSKFVIAINIIKEKQMLTVKAKDFNYTNGKNRVEGECLSTDTKPSNVANGSILIEIDTGKIFMYDESGAVWTELQ